MFQAFSELSNQSSCVFKLFSHFFCLKLNVFMQILFSSMHPEKKLRCHVIHYIEVILWISQHISHTAYELKRWCKPSSFIIRHP
ncbi:hypothetical protein HMPREF1305_05234 [Klebsiella pneumoniae subsp. pneumoniae WGLW1]|nr:hypothetical protein HMPREF1305_05234 [Klebsiella pneumoniae subsp. pneumoniae WGLW1]EKB72057.1 hypothetical protein HMPREF1307_05227 [Klebsiella pneumoniae subsp. pneumoniae WGLW3]